jgi:hypothetical protein
MKEIDQEFKERKDAADRAETNRRLDQTDVRLELLGKDTATRARNADTYASRVPGGGGGGGGAAKPPKAETTADLDRIVKRSEADAARVMGVDRKDFNSAYARLQKRTDPASVALLEKVQPYVDELNDASSRLKNWKAGAARTEAEPAAEKAPPKPDIASVKGVPSGSSVGNFVAGRGYEVKDRSGKVLGYVGK